MTEAGTDRWPLTSPIHAKPGRIFFSTRLRSQHHLALWAKTHGSFQRFQRRAALASRAIFTIDAFFLMSQSQPDRPHSSGIDWQAATVTEAAEVLGLERKQIQRYKKAPWAKRAFSADETVNVPLLIELRSAHQLDEAGLSAKKGRWGKVEEKHKALKRVDETRIRREQWVPVDVAARVIQESQERCRVRMQRVPRELPPKFATEVRAELARLIDRALTELAEMEWSKFLTGTDNSSESPKKRSGRRNT